MSYEKKFPAPPARDKRTIFRGDWPEFIAAVSYLSRPNRALVARIIRQLEQVQALHGDAVAEATVERIIRAIESEDGAYLS